MIQQHVIKNSELNWIYDDIKRNMVLTDDIDSLMSCALLTKYKGYEISKFYDFEKEYVIDEWFLGSDAELVGVDFASTQYKCIDNHVTRFSLSDEYNHSSINPNLFCNVSRNNYNNKFCVSSVLITMSVLGIDINKYTEEQLMVLLAIDSTFTGYLGAYVGRPQQIHINNFKYLGYPQIIDFLKSKTKQDFYKIINQYNLNGKIYVDEHGKLQTTIDIDAINNLFKDTDIKLEDWFIDTNVTLDKTFKRSATNKDMDNSSVTKGHLKKMYSFALTGKNYLSFTMI